MEEGEILFTIFIGVLFFLLLLFILAERIREYKNDKYKDAQKLGAEAVVGVSFSTSVMSQGAAELMAFGTAALIEDN
jgi:uncharacterized protein YbjQ (UPF0145 family)